MARTARKSRLRPARKRDTGDAASETNPEGGKCIDAVPVERRQPGEGNRSLIWSVLEKAQGPLTAYEIIRRLKRVRAVSPPTVYRALKGLMKRNQIHRIESLNAFVLCASTHVPGEIPIFMICDHCGAATELSRAEIRAAILDVASGAEFIATRGACEVRGYCAACAAEGSAQQGKH
jgi:Fur family transcriptional regulator, zinc uptake regulator